jgi:transcription termination factor Rho
VKKFSDTPPLARIRSPETAAAKAAKARAAKPEPKFDTPASDEAAPVEAGAEAETEATLSEDEEFVLGDGKSLASLPPDDRYEEIKRGDIHIAELQRMTMQQLLAQARKEQLSEYTGLKKQDLIFKILKERTKMNGLMFGEGTLEILPDGFGFLRSPDYHYLPCPDDIYVSPRFGRRKKTSGTSPCCGSRPSTGKTRTCSPKRSSSTI